MRLPISKVLDYNINLEHFCNMDRCESTKVRFQFRAGCIIYNPDPCCGTHVCARSLTKQTDRSTAGPQSVAPTAMRCPGARA